MHLRLDPKTSLYLSLVMFSALATACDTTTSDSLSQGPVPPPPPVLSMYDPQGATSGTQSSIEILFQGILNTAGSSVSFFSGANCDVLALSQDTSTFPQTAALLQLTLEVERTFTFTAKVTNGSTGLSSKCSAPLSYQLLDSGGGGSSGGSGGGTTTAPSTAPTSLSLNGTSSPGYSSSIGILVSGISTQATSVNLFTDSACTQAAGSTLTYGSTSNYVNTSTLTPATYTFYAAASNSAGSSPCSTASVSYTMLAPPVPTSISTSPASPGYASLPYFTIGGAGYGLTVKIYSDSACTSLLASGQAYGSSAYIYPTAALPYGTTTFYALTTNGAASSACSSALGTYVFQHLPAPSGLSLSYPSTASSIYSTPTITVSGTMSGETISLYKDSACTQQIGTASASGTTTHVTAQILGAGSYTLYAGAASSGSTSPCSTASVNYTVTSREAFSSPLTYQVGDEPHVIVSGDFNEDGKLDLITPNYQSNGANLLLGNGDGTFQSPSLFAAIDYLAGAAVGDFNGDGHLDVVLGGAFDPPEVFVYLGNGNGTFTRAGTFATDTNTSAEASVIVAADLNGDGKLDLAVLNGFIGGGFSVLLGNGDGTFQTATLYSASTNFSGLAAADMNGDGSLDLVLADGSGVSVWLNSGTGTFSSGTHFPTPAGSPSQPTPYVTAVKDLNGDGKLDVVVPLNSNGESSSGFSVLLGNGNGTLGAATSYTTPYLYAESIALGDIDGDGKTDIVVAYGIQAALSVYFGNGDGTFGLNQDYRTGTQAVIYSGIAFLADFNGDGLSDMACTVEGSNGWNDLVVMTNLGHP